MSDDDPIAGRFESWLAALEDRHLADFTPSEVARALRALSSCYVERRTKLRAGAALGTAGKRAAFALYYAPAHFLLTRHIVRSLALNQQVTLVYDLGCGTGAAGAAWALETGARIRGTDRHPWAVAEANRTYRFLGLEGRAAQGDLSRIPLAAAPGTGILAAYAVNELPEAVRADMIPRLLAAFARGAHVLVIEPIARRLTPWWTQWESAFSAAGGGAHEWRVDIRLPDRQRELAKAAGLNPQELTARSLSLKAPGRGHGP